MRRAVKTEQFNLCSCHLYHFRQLLFLLLSIHRVAKCLVQQETRQSCLLEAEVKQHLFFVNIGLSQLTTLRYHVSDVILAR